MKIRIRKKSKSKSGIKSMIVAPCGVAGHGSVPPNLHLALNPNPLPNLNLTPALTLVVPKLWRRRAYKSDAAVQGRAGRGTMSTGSEGAQGGSLSPAARLAGARGGQEPSLRCPSRMESGTIPGRASRAPAKAPVPLQTHAESRPKAGQKVGVIETATGRLYAKRGWPRAIRAHPPRRQRRAHEGVRNPG